MQHPTGTSKKTALDTLLNSVTAAGVLVIVEVATASPLIAKAREIAPTVPPVGIAILPLKKTL